EHRPAGRCAVRAGNGRVRCRVDGRRPREDARPRLASRTLRAPAAHRGRRAGRRSRTPRHRDCRSRVLRGASGVNGPLPWYVARPGGLVSWGLLTASTMWGLALSTKIFGRRLRTNWLLDLHRMLGGLALVFVGVHVTAILLDSYIHFGLT